MSLLRLPPLVLAIAAAGPMSLASDSPRGESVWFETEDRFRLHARFHDAGATAPVVLLLHQCDRDGARTGYESLALGLARRGIHAFELDFRGYGRSVDDAYDGSNWQQAGTHFSDDVATVLTRVASRKDVDTSRIAIVGASCGGRYAAALARSHRGIRALVFLSSSLGASTRDTLAGLAELPFLAIASEKDPYGRTLQSTREAFALSVHPETRLILYKGKSHGTPLFAVDSGLETLMADWLADRLSE